MSKSNIRRTVIREWMDLPRDKRQTNEQTASFVAEATRRHALPRSRRLPYDVALGWLLPRTAKR